MSSIQSLFFFDTHHSRLRAYWAERPVWLVLGLGALMFLPALGSVGLWDPWETHYAEVAREMLVRRDLVYPHWGDAYFYSKPVLTLWLIALGLWASGAEPMVAGAPLGSAVEWGVRLPFAGLSLACLWAIYRLGLHLGGRRAGLVAAFALTTSPLMIFVGKQAMTDIPVVATTYLGLAFLLPVCFEGPLSPVQVSRRRARLAAGAFLGLTGLELGIVAAGAASSLSRNLVLGLLPLVLAAAWHILRSKDPRTAELSLAGLCFGAAALAKGLEVAALIGPVFLLYSLLERDLSALRRARPWWVMLVAILAAAPWYLALSTFDGRDEEGLSFVRRFFFHDNFARVFSGVHGDRGGAGYYAEQLLYGFFPWIAVAPLALLGTGARRSARTFMAILAAFIYVFFTASATKLHHYIFPAVPALAVLIGAWWAELDRTELRRGAILLVLVIFGVGLRDLLETPESLVHLFTYKYDRSFPRELVVRPAIGLLLGGGGGLALLAWERGAQRASGRIFGATALTFGLWCSHVHFNALSPHYSQAHLFETYFAERNSQEPLYAYQLNWRGEGFYSRNEVVELMRAGAADRLREALGKSGRHFALIESNRFPEVRGLLPSPTKERLEIIDRSNEHFYLLEVENP
ncbi:MAG: glycosyltransferase family 39 protein [Myxococcota bacterium]